jgi:FtsZ-binding cell division protein ZapB
VDHNKILKDMKESIGTKEPIEYFDKLTDVLGLLFLQLEELKNENEILKTMSALAIEWDPQVAREMLISEVEKLRSDKDTFFNEISLLKKAYAEDKVTQSYKEFCSFWKDTLGWHPFMES